MPPPLNIYFLFHSTANMEIQIQLSKKILLALIKILMLIEQKQVGSKGMFYVDGDEGILAEMTYTIPSPDRMIIEHTEVNDELKGQNVGYQLVHAAVEYVRKHNIKIIPLCPFANAVFKKKPEYADVLYT